METMSKYMRWGSAPILATTFVLAACSLTACSGEKKSDTLAQDSALNSDIQLANRDSAAQPGLSDVPAATTPTPAPSASAPAATPRPRPRPTPAAPKPTTTTASGNTVTRTPGAAAVKMGTISAGSTLNLASNSRVCTNTNKVGDHINASLREAVAGSNGAVIPVGATVSLEVTELKRSENANDKISMAFRPVSVSFGGKTYPISGDVSYAQVDRVKNQPGKKDAQKVATGAAVGAVLGQVLGKNTKSTVIGGAIGAAAGAGAAAATSNYEGCVPDGGKITVSLGSSMQVQI
jgi:hypothetical protein